MEETYCKFWLQVNCKLIFIYQFCVHYGVLVHKGDVVTVVDGGIMPEPELKPKTSALSAQDCYCIA